MMNWKGCGRKRLWPELRHYLGIFQERLRKTKNHLRIVGFRTRLEPETSEV
jgi:hypothetical protein